MNYIIAELSNYIMCGLLFIYLIESIWPLFVKGGDRIKSLYIRQSIYVLLIYTLGTITLLINLRDNRYIIIYVFGIMIMFIAGRICFTLYRNISRMLLNHICLFLSIGFIIQSRISFTHAFRQLIIVAICVALFVAVPIVIRKSSFIQYFTYIYGTVGILMLLLVLSFGKSVNGSKLSFRVFSLTFQPSELVKVLFVFLIAGMLFESHSFKKIVLTTAFALAFIMILVLSRDLGTALIFFLTYMVMLYVATGHYIYSILGLIAGSIGAVYASKVFSHVMVRVNAWKNPWGDINSTGYQLAQSLFGIGTGGWLGMGLGKGEPGTIPLVDEDFVFSAICEEMGTLFGILLIITFLACTFLFLKIAVRTVSLYYKLIIYGLSTIFIAQVILTIGGGTRFIPLTGVTLPLISSGGSSAFTILILFGVIAGISMMPSKEELADKELVYDYPEDDWIYVEDGYYDEDDEYIDPGYYDSEGYYIENGYYDEHGRFVEIDDSYYDELYEEEERTKASKILFPRPDIVINVLNVLIFIGIIFNIWHFMHFDRMKAINNSYNAKRLAVLEEQNTRGYIYASDGSVLAGTYKDTDGNIFRNYPYGSLFSHVVGYSTYGTSGIESAYNIYLISSDIGVDQKIKNDMAGIKNPGNDVYTTLDPKLQQIAADSLGAYRGAVVVQEAKTGRILAMVSKPDYDPNSISVNMATLSQSKTEAPLLNRAAQGLYPPGSTFKIITTLEYIRENPDTYSSYSYNCSGRFTADGNTIKCYHGMTHGSVDLKHSFSKSCNCSYANIGLKLNRDQFCATLDELMFNANLDLGYDTKPSKISVGNDMTIDDMMQSSIGQGTVLMTPMHLNMITAAIANKGTMLKPYMVDCVKNRNGKVVAEFKPQEIKSIMSDNEAAILTDYMKEVVATGTAKKINDSGITIAGKTGSAEFADSSSRSHAWFTGFAPADDPEIVVTVIIENIGSGGDYSAPVAKRIITEYFAN